MYEAKLVAGEGPTDIDSPFSIDINWYSSLTKLWRITALVIRFIRKLRKQSDLTGPLEATEIINAENTWTTYIQKTIYRDVIDSIQDNKRHNLVSQLGLYLDKNGHIRCRRRLEHADICEGAKHPVLLPKDHRHTTLVIQMYHERAFHTGCSQTLRLLRHKFWIPQGRSAVRRVLERCVLCRRHEGGPYKTPLMSPIPTERVSASAPFTYTGVDYFGPLFIRTKGESQKVWVCLYTCLVVRAVHLELMYGMSAYQFLLGFRRFIAQHGKPCKIISDNAAHFKLASDTIDKIWGRILTEEDTVSYSANHNIQWTFTVELAPLMGGYYERLVGIAKRSLRKAIGKLLLCSEQLLTILKEAEAIINSRPLVYVGEDINSNMTLTPAHFLTLNPKIGLPASIQDDSEDADYSLVISSADSLLAKWKKGLKYLRSFWQIWRNDYLLSLRERSQIKLKESRIQSPYAVNIGDVVLIKDNLPRGSWRMGRIRELVNSRDGHVRSAKVLLPSNRMVGRPLNLLYPVECQVTETDKTQNGGRDDATTQNHGRDDATTQNRGRDDATTQDHGRDNATTQNRGRDDATTQNHGRDDAKSQNRGRDDAKTQNGGKDNSTTQNRGRDDAIT